MADIDTQRHGWAYNIEAVEKTPAVTLEDTHKQEKSGRSNVRERSDEIER